MTELLTSDERVAHDAAVAATTFRRNKRTDGWMIVGPMETAGQAMDGKPALCPVTKKGGEVKVVWILNSRRYFIDDDGIEFFAADIEKG